MSSFFVRPDRVLLPVVLALAWGLEAGPAAGQVGPRGAQTVPTVAYDAALAALGAGEYAAALDTAGRDYAGGLRVGNQRWIDSIASATALGEAHFEAGALREALASYEEAIRLATAHSEWLLSVQFPTQGPQAAARPRVAAWGRTARGTKPAVFPDTMQIRLQGADPQQVLKQGGVLTAPMNVPLRPQEIMRATAIAIYRRGVILGPLAAEGAVINELNTALAKRPAPPGHWSQAWIDIAQGTTAWSQGRSDQAAAAIEKGLTLGGRLDHPLTPWGLLVAGRIAMEKGDAIAAAKLFEEATYAAAEFADGRALEEGFRLTVAAHHVAGTPGVPATVRGGCEWAKGSLPVLRASLLAAEAEALASGGNPKGAAARLAEIDARLLQGDVGRGRVGAGVAHASALVAYALGDATSGDASMQRAVQVARGRSPRLFQSTRLVESVLGGGTSLSERQVDVLFGKLLSDPTPAEFAFDPLEGIAAMATPRTEAFDAWELVAEKRGNDAALSATEAALRARWMATEPTGGRRVALARLLAAPSEELPAAAAAARTALLGRRADLARSLDDETRVRATLSAALVAQGNRAPGERAAGAERAGEQAAWEEFAALAARHTAALDLVACGRDAIDVDFPPLLPPAAIRERLAAGEAILSFRWTAAGLRAALETRERVVTWRVAQPAALLRELVHLAKALCLFSDPHVPVPSDRIATSDWRACAATVEGMLFKDSKVNLAEGIDALAIVPDGALWYLPFDILPAGSAADPGGAVADGEGAAPPMLRDRCRIRYAPTRGLAVTGRAAANPDGPRAAAAPIGIHAGHAPRGEKPEVFAEGAPRLAASIGPAIPLATPPGAPAPVPTTLAAALCDGLVVLDEIDLTGEAPLASRPLFGRPSDRAGRGGGTFGDWLAPPRKRPSRVVLAGAQTPMASGLTKPAARPGEELFMAATDLLAAGARTVVLSRWRMGGRTSVDLVGEFLRDTDDATTDPAASWARAVDVVTREEPEVALEPRLRIAGQTLLHDLRHPLFWSGYLLVDGGTSEPAAPAPKPVPKPAAPRGRGAK